MTLPKLVSIVFFCTGFLHAATLDVQLDKTPSEGTIICMLYDTANRFGNLREAFRVEPFSIGPNEQYRLTDIPAGTYALVVFLDDNRNGFLDKTFIGIPREPIAFSNQYRPKGPPGFERAKFSLRVDQTRTEVMTLERVLGDRGRIGVGVGVIGRSSPYRDYSGNVSRVIPSVTYIGERFQILGPSVRLGLLGSGKTRLATTLTYRIGVYEENDSPYLQGMGDRKDTAMLGLAYQAELPGGLEGNISFDHDTIRKSPIVSEDHVLKAFFAVNYVF